MRKQETKYQKLSNWIKQKIETGEWKSGQKLYSENELSEMFELSRRRSAMQFMFWRKKVLWNVSAEAELILAGGTDRSAENV